MTGAPPHSDARDPDPLACPALGSLDDAERGYVLASLASGTTDAIHAVESLATPARARCADAMRALLTLERSERIRLITTLGHAAMAPLPAGIEDIDPGVVVRAISVESSDILRLIVDRGSAPESVRRAVDIILASREDAARAGPGIDTGDTVTDGPQRPSPPPLAPPPMTPTVLAQLQRAVLSPLFPL